MRNLFKKLTAALVVAGALLGFVPPAHAAGDIYDRLYLSRVPNANVVADDTDVALQIYYIGTAASGKVQVTAAGDLAFIAGASGSETNVGTGIKCPTGGTEGTIDVSDATCNTIKKVVDICNASTTFRCIPKDALLADATDAAGNLFLVAASASANFPQGLKIFWDTSQCFHTTRLLSPFDPNAYLQSPNRTIINPNPYDWYRTVLLKWTATSTYGSGTSLVQVIDSVLTFSNTSANTASETTFFVDNVAGGATTVAKTLDYTPFGVQSDIGHRLLVRIKNSAAQSSVSQYPYSLFFKVPKENASVR